MNNEPVAWMRENEVWEGEYNFSKEKPPAYPNAIPLYTHPVNPKYDPETGEPLIDGYPLFSGLPHPVKEQDTDCQYCKQGCIRCDARKQLTDEEIAQEWGNFCPNVLEFARAILRKAQEK